ncbi:hypothetical protein Tco_1276998 [Tanacetum coccineum]
MMYRGDYGDQYYHPAYESPSFFNQPQMSRKSAWVGLVNKLKARLSKWKVKTLSIGGRLTLLKSVLGAFPIYYMSIFKVPKGVLKTMESIRIKGHHEESVPLKVKEEVVEATTTPYLTTLKEPIPSSIEDTKSNEDEEFLALSLYKDECSNLLEEVKFTHTDQTLPQMPQVLTNKVGMDDLSYTKIKARIKVSFIEDQYVVEKLNKNSLCKLTHIILKQVHRKARVDVRNLSQFVCHGKKDFEEVSNYNKLINVASKRSRVKQVRSASSRRKRKRRVWVSKHKHFFGLRENNISKVFKNADMTWTRKAEIRQGNSYGKCSIKPP